MGWQHDQFERLGGQHEVAMVRRRRELEGLSLPAMDDEVSAWVGSEGVAVQTDNGVVLKMKSWWRRQCEKKEKRRWYACSGEQAASDSEGSKTKQNEGSTWRGVCSLHFV